MIPLGACRNSLAVCLSTIPAANTLLVCAGLECLLPFDHWRLSTALLSALPRPDGSPTFVKYSCPSLCVVFPLLAPCSKMRAACKSALRHGTQGWSLLWKGTLKKGLFCNDPQVFCRVWPCMTSSLPGLALRRAPRLLMGNCETAIAVARTACFHPRLEVYPMSGIICSQGGHLIAGQMAKAFSSASRSDTML